MMKRKLEIDALEVESFDTSAPGGPVRGTVLAHSDTAFLCDTQAHSCGWSDVDCPTQGCRTDFETCGDFGSCCPAVCW
ncbi:MAG TPA: hypothetical protein VJT67_06710 [Longimicrobiaceae bacterium]|nr:hypothetical protein [Longimicrobiaceae bacterium]